MSSPSPLSAQGLVACGDETYSHCLHWKRSPTEIARMEGRTNTSKMSATLLGA